MKKAALIVTALWGLVVIGLLVYLSLDRPSIPHSHFPSAELAQDPEVEFELENRFDTTLGQPCLQSAEEITSGIYCDIIGNESFPASVIRGALRIPSDAGPEESLAFVREAVRRFYLAYGYIHVQVDCRVASVDPPLFEVDISEGQKFVWSDFQIESKTLPYESLRQFFAVEKGHTVNMLEHVKSLEDLAEAFQEQGYLTFSYVPTVSADKELGTFSTKINVHEGPQYVLTEVSLASPDAKSVMRDLLGRPCNMFEVNRRLTRLGLAKNDVRIERNAERGEVYIRDRSKRTPT